MKYHLYGKGNGVISSIIVKTKQEIKIVFVRNRNDKDKWLAIASLDVSLRIQQLYIQDISYYRENEDKIWALKH